MRERHNIGPRYREIRLQPILLGHQQFIVSTRPGLGDETASSTIENLLACAPLVTGQRVLVSPCERGAVAAWAASAVASGGVPEVLAMDTNAAALDLTRQTLLANNLGTVRVQAGTPSASVGSFDVGLMPLPKGRALARLHILSMAIALASGGHLYLAGANDAGVKSVLADAELLFGPGELLSYRKGCRVTRFTRHDLDLAHLPAPFDTPGLLPGTFVDYSVALGERTVTVRSRPGVFSHGELDPGTAMLLANLHVRPDDRVLDWGCGSGIIGMAAALTAGAERVTLLDIDSLACECAKASLAANGLAAARVVHADGLAAVCGERFDLIVSNPPFHSGHAVNTAAIEVLISEAYQALANRGRLVIVANRFLPYERLLTTAFGEIETLAADGRYKVLLARKSKRKATKD